MYDSIVIGGGPAGMAAAIYLARQKVKFAMLTGDIGGKTLLSSDVENYLGFHLLNGVDLVQKFSEHLMDYQKDFELKEGELATNVEQTDGGFRVTTAKGSYEAKTVLITTGEDNRKLNVPGEKELYGHGVTYCAACDGPLYGGKNVHVIGGGNSAMDAALLLGKYASHVTLVTVNASLMGDAQLRKSCESGKMFTVLTNTKTTKIVGGPSVTGIGLQTGDGPERVEPSDGVFIEIGLVPVSGFISIVEKTKWNEIIVDKKNQTSVPGIFAAGDVTDVTEKQIAVAVGEGSKASLEIIKYLQHM